MAAATSGSACGSTSDGTARVSCRMLVQRKRSPQLLGRQQARRQQRPGSVKLLRLKPRSQLRRRNLYPRRSPLPRRSLLLRRSRLLKRKRSPLPRRRRRRLLRRRTSLLLPRRRQNRRLRRKRSLLPRRRRRPPRQPRLETVLTSARLQHPCTCHHTAVDGSQSSQCWTMAPKPYALAVMLLSSGQVRRDNRAHAEAEGMMLQPYKGMSEPSQDPRPVTRAGKDSNSQS